MQCLRIVARWGEFGDEPGLWHEADPAQAILKDESLHSALGMEVAHKTFGSTRSRSRMERSQSRIGRSQSRMDCRRITKQTKKR